MPAFQRRLPALPGTAEYLVSPQVQLPRAEALLGAQAPIAQALSLARSPEGEQLFGAVRGPLAGVLTAAQQTADLRAAQALGDEGATELLARGAASRDPRLAAGQRMADLLLAEPGVAVPAEPMAEEPAAELPAEGEQYDEAPAEA